MGVRKGVPGRTRSPRGNLRGKARATSVCLLVGARYGMQPQTQAASRRVCGTPARACVCG